MQVLECGRAEDQRKFLMFTLREAGEQERICVNKMCDCGGRRKEGGRGGWGAVACEASPLHWSGKSAISHVTGSLALCYVQRDMTLETPPPSTSPISLSRLLL